MTTNSEIFKVSYLKDQHNWSNYIIAIVVVVIGYIIYKKYGKTLQEGFENAKNQFLNSQTTLLSSVTDDSSQSGTVVKYISNGEVFIQVYANLFKLNEHIYKDQFSTDIKYNYRVYLHKSKDDIEKIFIGELSIGSDQVYKLRGKTDISANYYRYISIDVTDGTNGKQVLLGQFK